MKQTLAFIPYVVTLAIGIILGRSGNPFKRTRKRRKSTPQGQSEQTK